MILYIQNPKDATRKLLEINESGKVAGYKSSTQKSTAFLYINNERSEREIRKDPIYHCIKKNKMSRNEPKEAKDLYPENCKIQMKEIKDDTNR